MVSLMENNTEMLARLEAKAQFHAQEAERYRVAIDVIRGESETGAPKRQPVPSRRARSSGDSGKSTPAMILRALAASSEPLDIAAITARMLDLGWQTESAAPTNTVRTAIGREVVKKTVRKADNRRYELFSGVQQEDVLWDRDTSNDD